MNDRASVTSRRGFARALATAVAAPALLPAASALSQTPAAAPTPAPTPTPVPTPEAPSSAAEALTEVVRIRWGKNLTGEQLESISRTIDGRLRAAETMKKTRLANGDEPDVVFAAGPDGGAS